MLTMQVMACMGIITGKQSGPQPQTENERCEGRTAG